MNTLSSHILDTTSGKPVPGLTLILTTPSGEVFTAQTDEDGRCKSWGPTSFESGDYSLRFECQSYLVENYGQCFYPFIDIAFTLVENGGHYHVPLLISPFGFSSYRGS
ncbi:hydroxyisourate hydrolase [Glaciecola sp. 1036]|uniref:hydroxyisourate hydrolase n=1 Tax=Alteromonadaceae TaxID=72275 RepID=UPI003D03F872